MRKESVAPQTLLIPILTPEPTCVPAAAAHPLLLLGFPFQTAVIMLFDLNMCLLNCFRAFFPQNPFFSSVGFN